MSMQSAIETAYERQLASVRAERNELQRRVDVLTQEVATQIQLRENDYAALKASHEQLKGFYDARGVVLQDTQWRLSAAYKSVESTSQRIADAHVERQAFVALIGRVCITAGAHVDVIEGVKLIGHELDALTACRKESTEQATLIRSLQEQLAEAQAKPFPDMYLALMRERDEAHAGVMRLREQRDAAEARVKDLQISDGISERHIKDLERDLAQANAQCDELQVALRVRTSDRDTLGLRLTTADAALTAERDKNQELHDLLGGLPIHQKYEAIKAERDDLRRQVAAWKTTASSVASRALTEAMAKLLLGEAS